MDLHLFRIFCCHGFSFPYISFDILILFILYYIIVPNTSTIYNYLEGIFMKEYIRTRHSVYLLTYHMVFVTKWRKPVITDEIGDFMVSTAKRLCDGYGGELISGETDRDHIHLLVSLPPSKNITDIVRSLKTQLSKEVHAHPEYDRIVKKKIYGNAPLWSPSYFVATTGSVSMDVVKQYIEGQRTDEHKRKYEKRSLDYWNSRL